MLCLGISRLKNFLPLAVLLMAGCSTTSTVNGNANGNAVVKGASGSIHGGQQPISGATVQLYAVGTAGDGSAATTLLTSPVLTNAGGAFTITGLYTCPSSSALVYITGTGGSPAPGVTNPQLALMAALGPCGALSASTFISINEITTVAATYALAPFMSSFSAIGSGPSDATALASAFAYAGYLANTTNGTTPGLNIPANYAVPVAQVDTIADLLAACINSPGGVSGDGSVCGSFFALTLPSGAPGPPDNTLAALLNLANNPTLNTAALYNLVPATSPFQPAQSIAPPDLAIRLLATSAFIVSPSSLTFSPAVIDFTQPTQNITVTNGTSAGVNITSASITGVNASDFALVPQPGSDCAITVPANATCTFGIAFVPSAAGARAAYLILANTSANPSIAVPLGGTGASGSAGPVTLTPSSLAFTQLGIPQILTLTNTGSSTLSINSIAISGTEFIQTNNCGSSLPASASCTLTVSDPSSNASAPATLTVTDDAATGPQAATLSYSGPAQPPTFPASVDFGHWAIGATGNQLLNVGGPGASGSYSFTITGPNAGNFSFAQNSSVSSTTCSYDYRFEQQCYLNIYYTPSTTGSSTAFVNIAGFGRFTLTGIGDPAGVDFDFYQYLQALAYGPLSYTPPINSLTLPSIPLGTSTTLPFVLQNTGTVPSLATNPPVISGPAAADFTVTIPAPPNAILCIYFACPVVTFTPTAIGTRTATLTYTDATNTVTRTLTLTGTATTPAPVLTAAHTLLFSGIPAGTVSAPQTITINAYGNHPIQASITPIPTGASQPFIFTGPTFCPSTPCTVSIAYAPTSDPSTQSANAYVVATDTLGLSTGNIQAIGRVAPLAFLDLNPDVVNFAPQALTTVSPPQAVTLTNIGNSVLPLSFQLSQGSADFTFNTNCPSSLAIGAACTVNVSFTPVDATGLVSGILQTGQGYISLSGNSF